MFIDNALVLDPFAFNGGTPTAITTAAASANVYDISGAGYGNAITNLSYGQLARSSQVFGDDYGLGSYADNPIIFIQVATTFTAGGGGATGMTIALQEGADNGSNAVTTWVTISTTGIIPIASLTGPTNSTNPPTATAGFVMQLPFPVRPPGLALPRFVRLYYTPTGGSATFSAGAISSGFALGYKSSFTGVQMPNNYVTWNG